jgi:hypothetical protein
MTSYPRRLLIATLLMCSGVGACRSDAQEYVESAREGLFRQTDSLFADVRRQLPSAQAALAQFVHAVAMDRAIPTPHRGRSPFAGRYSAAEVGSFLAGYRRYAAVVDAPTPQPSQTHQAVFLSLLHARLSRIAAAGHLTTPITIEIDTSQRNYAGTRHVVGAPGYIISLGSDFVRRLDESVLVYSDYLRNNFLQKHTSFRTEGMTLRDMIGVGEFVDVAPQLHPQNLIPVSAAAQYGGRANIFRSLHAMFLKEISKSPRIPRDLKLASLTTTPTPELRLPAPPSPVGRHAQVFDPDNPYLVALHYYMLRDVLTYLVAHEVGHVVALETPGGGGSGLRAEVDADRYALSLIINELKDTDPRAITLAMIAFVNEQGVANEEDRDHPIAGPRLGVLFQSLRDLSPNLLLDVDAGQELLQRPVTKSPGEAVDVSEAAGHALRFRISRAGDAEGASTATAAQIEVALYDVLNPQRIVSQGTFTGSIPVVLHETTYPARTYRTADSKVAATGAVDSSFLLAELTLHSALWTQCPTCDVRVLRYRRVPYDTTARWNVAARPLEAMTAAVQALPGRQKVYNMLFLARSLYRESRSDEAATVYAIVEKEEHSLLSPADWVRWAASLPDARAPEAANILGRGVSAYPNVHGLAYAAGIEAEIAGQPLSAIDYYFLEAYGFAGSDMTVDAMSRFQALMAASPPGSTAGKFYQAYKYHAAATTLLNELQENAGSISTGMRDSVRTVIQVFDSRAAAEFHRIATQAPLFSAKLYEAEAALDLFNLNGGNSSPIKQQFTALVADRPSFIPSYLHLFTLTYCAGNTDEAARWIVEGIRQDPVDVHPRLVAALETLDHSGTCT